MEKKKNKLKNCFIAGPISSSFIGDSIAKHQSKKSIGAHQIFLGQVRSDQIKNKEVSAIDYSAQQEMANETFHLIREKTFEKFELIFILQALPILPRSLKVCREKLLE